MISFSIKYKIIFRIMSKVTHYIVGFGEKTAKYEHSKFQYFQVRYTLPLATKKNNYNNMNLSSLGKQNTLEFPKEMVNKSREYP